MKGTRTEFLALLLAELEAFAAEHDRTCGEPARRLHNITRDTGEFLSVLIRATSARRVLELGTSNGYSTLWLAGALVATAGSITTVESTDYKVELARPNFRRSGVDSRITLVHDDATRVLEQTGEASCDFVFLDSERAAYPRWWPQVRRVLRSGGLLVADNAISHAEELAPFMAVVRADPGFTTSLVPVGKGEFLAVKSKR
jgi:predicted O-methyltransferase YrrM